MTRAYDTAATQRNSGGAVAGVTAGKNAIINGALDNWQRGTSFTAQSVYGPDRWFLTGVTGQMTFTQVTSSLPSGFQYAIKLQRNSGATNTDIFSIAQPFETSASIPLQGQTVTLSFWAKAGANFSASGGFGLIRLYSGTGTNQAASSQFGAWTGYSEWQNTPTFAPTSTWTRFTCTGTVPSNATQIGLRIGFAATGTAGADDSLQITGVQLEAGSVATPFSRAGGTIQGELAACQRYFSRYTSTAAFSPFATGMTIGTTGVSFIVPFKVRMRTNPTFSFSAANTFAAYTSAGGVIAGTSIVLDRTGDDAGMLTLSVASGLTAGQACNVITNASAVPTIDASAEL